MACGKEMRKKIIVIVFCCLILIVFIFLKHNKCISIYLEIYYSHARVKDKKYGYFYINGEYEGLYFINECTGIKSMQDYYTRRDTSIDFMFGYLKPFIKYEVLDYDYEDSTAIIRTYNYDRGHLNEIGSVIVSMYCLHDSLPYGKEEIKGW